MRNSDWLTRREFARSVAAFGLSAALPLSLPGKDRKKKLHPDSLPVPQRETRSYTGSDSLRVHAAAVGLLAGCAVVPELLNLTADGDGIHDVYTQTVAEQAGILVAENAMKWSSLRPSPSSYNFAPVDKIFAFAAQYQQFVRGHNLCWHEQLPLWFAQVATKDNARSLLEQHIQTVAGRYAGRVHSWDVVNEAVHIPGGRADGLRKSPWLELLGPGYIEMAFQYASQADPQAKLTYNDFDIELDTPEQSAKRGQVLMLVRRLHARGVPIHAVGIQSHLQANGPPPGAGVKQFIRDLAAIGLDVYLTELDVNSHALPGGPELQDVAVSEIYKNYLGLVLPEPNVKAVLTWGITDAHTWLNQSRQPWAMRPDGARQRPLPFDDNYTPMPAFFAMRDAMDFSRMPITPADITAPLQQPAADPYAPFAVPGSPETPQTQPKP
ncbi:endo-1,4-beta-xylanase [Acidicapsa ligni]|uniref:endo-1,4-beta-xylanase n=1 Tax=Acidicapsa ligni TaxID=542300 RepID=UPI0021DFFE80|nr:endo-1,4-beta-xylanase [Acidicapsa ligni]